MIMQNGKKVRTMSKGENISFDDYYTETIFEFQVKSKDYLLFSVSDKNKKRGE